MSITCCFTSAKIDDASEAVVVTTTTAPGAITLVPGRQVGHDDIVRIEEGQVQKPDHPVAQCDQSGLLGLVALERRPETAGEARSSVS